MPKTMHSLAYKCEQYMTSDINEEQTITVWKETLVDRSLVYSVTIEDIRNFIDIPCGESVYKAALIFKAATGEDIEVPK